MEFQIFNLTDCHLLKYAVIFFLSSSFTSLSIQNFYVVLSIKPEGASQVALVVQNPPARAKDLRDAEWTPGRSSGGGCGNPLQNPMDREAW